MVDIIDTSNSDGLSAFVTAGYISHTYKVESTRTIVDTWNDFRNRIKVENNLDFVSILLAIGRMMDIKNEVPEERFIEMINEIKETIINDLKTRGHSSDLNKSYLLTAMITSACISKTEEVETISEILNHWETVNSKLIIKDDIDLVAGVLTIGRIYEYKYSINNFDQIVDVYIKLREYLEPIIGDNPISQNDLAAAFFTSAYLEITPKVEKIHDMISTWQELRKNLNVKDNFDYVSVILAHGKIRDLDAQFFLTDTSIMDIKDNIRNYIETIK